jgi:hypothetical protein
VARQNPALANFLLGWFSTLKMEAIRSSKTSVHIHTTQRYIPEDDSVHNYRCENLKSYVICLCFLVRIFLWINVLLGVQGGYRK